MPTTGFGRCAILILEDNEDDALLLRRALNKQEFANPVHFVQDGQEAIAYLSGTGKYANRNQYPVPGFIITDLKMPLLSGLEFLQWLRENPRFRRLPILVLTSSAAENDIAAAYGSGANSYMVKPTTMAGFEQLARVIRDYWRECEMPPNSQG